MATNYNLDTGDRKERKTAEVSTVGLLDSGLVEAIAKDRSREAFSELFDRYAPKVRFFAMKMGADGPAADEVVQEAMLAVWRKAETFDPSKASFSTWLYTVARNKRITMLKLRPQRWIQRIQPMSQAPRQIRTTILRQQKIRKNLVSPYLAYQGTRQELLKCPFMKVRLIKKFQGN